MFDRRGYRFETAEGFLFYRSDGKNTFKHAQRPEIGELAPLPASVQKLAPRSSINVARIRTRGTNGAHDFECGVSAGAGRTGCRRGSGTDFNVSRRSTGARGSSIA